MAKFTTTEFYLKTAGANLVAGILSAAKVGLFIGSIVPTPTTLLADLTASGSVPTYTGYAEISASFGAVHVSPDLTYVSRSALLVFTPSGGTPSDLITGVYVTDGAMSPKLIAAGRLDDAYPISSLDSALALVAEIVLPLLGWGGPVVVG